jgi:hypothetical protein
VNTRAFNVFTAIVIAVLVMLSVILTASTLFPDMGERGIAGVLIGGTIFFALLTTGVKLYELRRGIVHEKPPAIDPALRDTWRMPALNQLPPAHLTTLNKVWMAVLRGYLVVAAGMLIVKLVQVALSAH